MGEAQEDSASTLLWECGTLGLEVLPASDGSIVLLAYFDATPGLQQRLVRLLPDSHVEPATVPDVDWVARVREGFRPFQVGPFRIVPAWEAAGLPPMPLTLVVDPGRAFGTGTHETTQLCLQGLLRTAASRPLGHVLDLGAGTGILAVAALRLGARSAIALDVDAEAIDSVRRHALLNGVALPAVRGDGPRPFREGAFDLILANVTLPLLLGQREAIVAALRPGGAAVLSGFLVDDAAALRAAYSAFGSAEVLTAGDWAAALFSRTGRP